MNLILNLGTMKLAWPQLMTVFHKIVYGFVTADIWNDDFKLSVVVILIHDEDKTEPINEYFSDAGYGSR